MPSVTLCQDGLTVSLESEGGLWLVLSETENGRVLGKFAVDPTEMQALMQGEVSYQATDGLGSSVSLEGAGTTVKIRLERRQSAAKRCVLQTSEVKNALESIQVRV